MIIKNRNGFTLIEVLISIVLFSIIVLFLYKSLDITQDSNQFYSKKLDIKKDENSMKRLLFLDFIHIKDKTLKTTFDGEKNSIVSFQSDNTYHNPFYTHISYFISKEKNLIRVESKTEFDTKKLSDSFFEHSYIDIIDNNVSKFKIQNNIETKKVNFYIENEDGNKIFFSI